MMNIIVRTENIENLAEIVLNTYVVDDDEIKNEDSVCFTFDEDFKSKSTGWFGIQIIKIFDGEALVIGYMGGGGIKTYSLNDDTFTKDYIASCIRAYLWLECYSEQDKVVVSVIKREE